MLKVFFYKLYCTFNLPIGTLSDFDVSGMGRKEADWDPLLKICPLRLLPRRRGRVYLIDEPSN